MNHNDVRAGVSQAKITEDGWKALIFEILLIGSAVGYRMNSWGWGIVACVFLLVIFWWAAKAPPPVSDLIALVMGVIWGVIAFVVNDAGMGIRIIVALLVFGVAAGVHINGLQYMRDISKRPD